MRRLLIAVVLTIGLSITLIGPTVAGTTHRADPPSGKRHHHRAGLA
jgi:hypothetical protein